MASIDGPQVPCRLETVRDWFLRQDSRQRGFSSLACRKLPPVVGRSYSTVGAVGGWSRATRWPRCHFPPRGPLGRWQTSRECHRFLRWRHAGALSESWVASLPLGWKRAYNGVRFWRWWVSQGNWPSGSHDLMYPPRSVGGGFAFRSALALRMAVAR